MHMLQIIIIKCDMEVQNMLKILFKNLSTCSMNILFKIGVINARVIHFAIFLYLQVFTGYTDLTEIFYKGV